MREDREQQNPRQRQRGGGGGRGDHQANGGRGGGGGGENVAGRQLYVGNLSFETTWADLKDHFRSAGEVERADVMMDGSRRSKGWGTVRFSTPVRRSCHGALGHRLCWAAGLYVESDVRKGLLFWSICASLSLKVSAVTM